jgi:hypothetical protein
LIVSVHLPKTAGTSFKDVLRQHYGWKLHKDNRDFPIHQTDNQRQQQALEFAQSLSNRRAPFHSWFKPACIHGHFLPRKYLPLAKFEEIQFVCWMREPAERLLSHYHFWKRSYHPEKSQALQRRVVEENWSLERFCFSPEMQNLYARLLWQFPLERFDFIGITEFYETDLQAFARQFWNKELSEIPESNRHSSDPMIYRNQLDGLWEDIRSFHQEDYALYEQALQQRKKRLAKRQAFVDEIRASVYTSK